MSGYLINLYCLLMCSYAYPLMMICVVVNVNDGVNLAVAHYDNAVAKLHIELSWQKIVKVKILLGIWEIKVCIDN